MTLNPGKYNDNKLKINAPKVWSFNHNEERLKYSTGQTLQIFIAV